MASAAHCLPVAGLALAAWLSGWIEHVVMRDGFRSTGRRIPTGLFTLSYHWPIIALWLLICLLAGHGWFIGLYAVIQDVTWFAANPRETLGPEDWVNYRFGGTRIGRAWLPTTYLLLAALSGGLAFIQFRIL